jgi:hypothetical protein
MGPLAQARDTARQEEEEELAYHNLRRVTIERRKKGLHSSTKDKKQISSQLLKTIASI